MAGVLKGSQVPPNAQDLEYLATEMNATFASYAFSERVVKSSGPRAAKVRMALEVLQNFFEERAEACGQKDRPTVGHEIYAREEALFHHFQKFMEAMRSHQFDLDMDAGTIMPVLEGWHSIATLIALNFKVAMARSNSKIALGLSNEGPIPRFVAATVPIITGETPSVQAVGKWLKDEARRQGKQTGTTIP